jgi:dynamin GTPase
MERQRREEELKGRSSKKGQDAEQSLLNRVCFYLRTIWIHLVDVLLLFFCDMEVHNETILFLLVHQATSPQPDGPSSNGGILKSLRDKLMPQDKDKYKEKETPEVSGL